MRYMIRSLSRIIILIAFALISFQIFFNAPASTAKRSSNSSSDWEERVLGLRRPNQIRNNLFWRSQAAIDSNRANDQSAWLLGAEIFERLSPAAQSLLIERYKLAPSNPQSDTQQSN